MIKIDEPRFSTSDALRATAMNIDEYKNWTQEETQILPTLHMEKRLAAQRFRNYHDFIFVMHGRMLKKFTSMGFLPSLASEIVAGFTLQGNSDPRLPDRNPCELFATDYTYLVVKGRTGWVVPADVKTTVFDLRFSTMDPTPTSVLLAIEIKQIFQETCYALGLAIGTDDKMRLVPVER